MTTVDGTQKNLGPNKSPAGSTDRMKLVSLSLAVPSTTVPHAGGQYVRSHLEFLSEHFDIDIVAPENDKNLAELPRYSPRSSTVHLLRQSEDRSPRLRDRLRQAVDFLDDGQNLGAAILADSKVRDAISSSDVVEFQWNQMLTGIDAVRELTSAPTVAICHDVVSQARARQYEARGRRALTNRLLVVPALNFRNRTIERSALNRVDLCIVFSEKDKGLLSEMGVKTKVEVVNPPIMASQPQARNVDPSNPRVLFVGAFQRTENDEAAHWLIKQVWPAIHRAVPNAQLVLCGAMPSEKLQYLAAASPNVQVTGFVDDLEAMYSTASVVVVPLLTGAGVKFKTISAMVHGVPVVSTPIGAEGIGGAERYVAVTIDPDRFAEATVRALADPEGADRDASLVQSWAQYEYSASTVSKQIQNAYLKLL